MEIVALPIGELVFDPSNARKHSPKNLDAIKGSLAKFGQQKPIVIDKNNVVIAGNGTLEAAKQLGWDSINVVKTDLEGTNAAAFAIADNRTGELAEWDDDALKRTLEALKADGFGLDQIGFDDEDLEQWLTPTQVYAAGCDEDEIPENVETRCKPGDVWQLGDHRLMCGDSTSLEHMAKLTGGEKFDMVFTSPPYNVDIGYSFHNDKLPEEKFLELLRGVMESCIVHSTDDLWILWNMGCSQNSVYWKQVALAESLQLKVNRTIIWKKSGTTGLPVFQHTRNKPFTKNYIPHFGYEFIFTFHKQKSIGKAKLSEDLMDRRQSDVWEVPQMASDNKDRGKHPAAFPTNLAVDGIELFADKAVFEPFCGSGTTLIACEKTGRKCFGMEIDPKYCDVILARWEKYAGKKATLVTA